MYVAQREILSEQKFMMERSISQRDVFKAKSLLLNF